MFSVRQVPEANSLKALMTGARSKICIEDSRSYLHPLKISWNTCQCPMNQDEQTMPGAVDVVHCLATPY